MDRKIYSVHSRALQRQTEEFGIPQSPTKPVPVHISELQILLWDSPKAGCLFLKTLVAVVAIGVVLYLISVCLILYISAISVYSGTCSAQYSCHSILIN